MARLTRAQQQGRTRAAVLDAARREFAERGYAEAKIDRIADRAELTRGAVYSNFTGKRALYLAVLGDLADRARTAAEPPAVPPGSTGPALGAFARVWLERLPLGADTPGSGRLQLRSLTGVLETEPSRAALAEILRFEAVLLALALEHHAPDGARRVRLAELTLTLLHGAAALAENAPGVGDPFDLARAAEHLASLPLADDAAFPHLPFVAPARSARDPWSPPSAVRDELTGRQVALAEDGVVVALGVRRLSAAEEAVRSAAPGDAVTVVVVTDGPDEAGQLARLRVIDLVASLRRVFPPGELPALRVVFDEGDEGAGGGDGGTVSAALGHPVPDDLTETAVRVRDGLVVARAEGRGAGYAVAATELRGAGGARAGSGSGSGATEE
ncbi:TetR family transcriptional regulator [Streptomyces sp. NPDC048172]|uniref:TetR family transcriptional regulator n=1 Tax=Streptomyces sp. NPDC048172 TaxID=3365505 RepID=UPI0037167E13